MFENDYYMNSAALNLGKPSNTWSVKQSAYNNITMTRKAWN